jgi:hypothetical protein
MKRRDFLKGSLMVAGLATVLGKAAGLFNQANAAVFAKKGALGYVEVSPANQAKAGKFCSTCSWYKADAATKDAGQCTLKAMQGSMKVPVVHVANGAYCNMWKKKA